MQIIAHEPLFWFFLQHENNYYLDVNCSYSFVGFSRLIKLTEAETKAYLEKGNAFLNEFANDVQYYAQSTHADRHIMGEIGDLVHEAITEYNAKKE